MTDTEIIFITIMLAIGLGGIIHGHMQGGKYNLLRDWRNTLKCGDVVMTTGRPAKYEIRYIEKPRTRHSIVILRIHETQLPCIKVPLMHIFPVDNINE